MTGALTRGEIARNQFTLTDAVRQELERLRETGDLGDGTKTEPRCFICCEVESKDLVNKLLAAGLTNREIAESCSSINNRRKAVGDDRLIEARNVWWHRKEHFNVDDPVRAAYRSIVEREAENAHIDHINGIGTALSPYAVLHTVMVKGFGDIAAGSIRPSVGDTLKAAKDIHEMTSREAGQKKMADMMYLMDRIILAAQHFVPEDKHEDFLAMVEGHKAPNDPLAVLTDKAHDVAHQAVREFTPRTMRDEDDTL